MASNIHGFRYFSLTRCEKVPDVPVLVGAKGMHLHQRVQQAAKCDGISYAMWMTESARERDLARQKGGATVPHEGPAPDWNCSCGHYMYRLLKDCWNSPTNVYAHVTCLERTMLHESGGRTTQYSVDYLLAPHELKDDQNIYLYLKDPDMAKGKMAPLSWGFYPGMFGYPAALVEELNYGETLLEVAKHLDVPVLARNDLSGCPDCLLANSWAKPEEVTEEMRRQWYGAGYVERERQHERDMGEVT